MIIKLQKIQSLRPPVDRLKGNSMKRGEKFEAPNVPDECDLYVVWPPIENYTPPFISMLVVMETVNSN